jgi:Protein of unknown function (DUF4058)
MLPESLEAAYNRGKDTTRQRHMQNPFPGMNPYLEQAEFWSDFPAQLIAACARILAPQLLPKYRVVTDKWMDKVTNAAMTGIGRPDLSIQQSRDESLTPPTGTTQTIATIQPIAVQIPIAEEVQQSYLEVRDAATKEVVTTIELLSPANKKSEGRRKYESKRQGILESLTHLVEIDLLRDGDPLPMAATNVVSHYRVLVSRSTTRPIADLYAFNLGDRIPAIPIPLQPEDTEPLLDIQMMLNDLYVQLGYGYFIDYTQAPPLPWSINDVKPLLNH